VRVNKGSYDSEMTNGQQSHTCKLNQIKVRRIRIFPFSADSASDLVTYDLVKTRLSELEAEAEG